MITGAFTLQYGNARLAPVRDFIPDWQHHFSVMCLSDCVQVARFGVCLKAFRSNEICDATSSKL